MADNTPDIQTHAAGELKPFDRRRYEDTLHCNRCGFCTSFCPTYLATGDEGLSPRGRNQALRAVYEGRLEDPKDAARPFDTCLQCGICTSVCFAEVPTAKLMGAAKAQVAARHGVPALQQFLLRALLPRPRLLAAFLWPLFLVKKTGLPRLFNRLGLLRLVSPSLAAAEEMADEVSLRFLRSSLAPAPADAEVVQFVSCGTGYLDPDAGRATAGLLNAAGCRHGAAGTVCCGLPGASLGDLDAARALAKINIEALEKFPRAVVLVDDSSCTATLKDYPSFFEDDPAWLLRARALAARTKDLSEWLLGRHPGESRDPGVDVVFQGDKEHLGPGFRRGDGIRHDIQKVTYHDPCKARYAQKLIGPPREILKTLPGVDYVELPEADQCCGGGGTAAFRQPELSRAVLDRKAAHIVSTGADVVVTSSASCLMQLKFGLKRAGSAMKALHLSSFLLGRRPK